MCRCKKQSLCSGDQGRALDLQVGSNTSSQCCQHWEPRHIKYQHMSVSIGRNIGNCPGWEWTTWGYFSTWANALMGYWALLDRSAFFSRRRRPTFFSCQQIHACLARRRSTARSAWQFPELSLVLFLSDSVCFPSRWEKQNSGFTRTRKLSTYGRNIPRHSS